MFKFFFLNLIIIFLFLITLILIEYILLKYNSKTYIIIILFLIYIFPILVIFVYIFLTKLFFKKLKNKKIKILKSLINNIINEIKKKQKKSYNQKYTVAIPLFNLLIKKNGINEINIFFKKKEFKVFSNTKKIFKKIIYDIKYAKYKIEMIFYIWKQGGMVDKVMKALINASKRGLCCRIILDSIGCFSFLYSKYPKIMRKAGIEIVEAFKINVFWVFLRRIDIRQHKKLILIDNNISYIGSMNMIDNNYYKNKINKFIDIMIRFEGKISNIMSIVYGFDWEMETGKRIISKKQYKNIKESLYHKKNQNFHIISSELIISKKLIHDVFLTAIYSAKKKLVITTPYFVPTNNLIKAICDVSLKGVEVIIVLSKYNDSLMVLWASKYFYNNLLKSGVKIYEFKKFLLHTKSLLIDDKVSILGTVNFDIRSFCLNSEIILVIEDNNFSSIISQIQKKYIKKSKFVNFIKWKNRSFLCMVIEYFFFLFNPIL
ncbi:MAG: cardiolipin synthase [Enterobacteriaceae bacterium PSmelAO1]|nr:MAG: cardiolipin synthase [Enterobacteriaceae bacterium PSmelAO1]